MARLPASRSDAHAEEFGTLASNAHFSPSRSGLSAATTTASVSELPWRRPIGHSMTMDSSISDAWAPSSLPSTASAMPGSASSASLSTSPSRLPRLRMRLGSGASDTGRARAISKEAISGPAALQSAAGVARLREKASAERVRATRTLGARTAGRASMRREMSAPHMGVRAGRERVQSEVLVASSGGRHRRAEALRGEGAGAAHKRSRPLGRDGARPGIGSGKMTRNVTAAEVRGTSVRERPQGEEFVSNAATWDADGSL
ncbi:hypothetical protein HDZ31DRAFT_32246 [Schizophyllum fasciatum]